MNQKEILEHCYNYAKDAGDDALCAALQYHIEIQNIVSKNYETKIRYFVLHSYGLTELKSPSWDIKALADHLAGISKCQN